MTSVLVLGAEGMLGHQVERALDRPAFRVSSLTREGLRAEDEHRVAALVDAFRPDVLINCIGWVRQRPVAGRLGEAIFVNAVFPHRLADLCRSRGIELIHISTDCVGDTDWYGDSKRLGESIEYGVVLRTSFIGHELHRRLGLLEWVLAQHGTVPGWANVLWNGLTTNELADVIVRRVLPNLNLLTGWVWEVTGPEITKFALLQLINDVYRCGLEVIPVEEPRMDRRLDGKPFADRVGYITPAWRPMLETMRAAQAVPEERAA